jgi:transcriptional regulator with XRE-family HTH domain
LTTLFRCINVPFVKLLTKDQVIALLKKRQGERTQQELAEELGVSQQYLSDVLLGRRDPGPAVLDKLNLRQEMVYFPTDKTP